MSKPLITNDRAQKEWDWIVEQVGLEAAQKAIHALPGAQRPYPLNVARKLRLKLPEHFSDQPAADREVAHAFLDELKASLRPSRPLP